MNIPSNLWRIAAVVLLCAWLSAATMLVPWPPVVMDIFASKGIAIPAGAVWIRWLPKLVLVLCGVSAALMWLRGRQRAFRILIVLSVLYLGYWISGYLLTPGEIGDLVRTITWQISNEDGLRKLTILQHQIILPVIHLVFLILAAVRRLSAPAAKAA